MNAPKQSDWEAANSATPDTDKLPSWDDEGWDQYLYAVDINYRVEWDLAHGVPREEVQQMLDEWNEWNESHDEE